MTLDTVIQSLLLLPLWGAAAEGIPGPSYQLVAGARPDTLLVRFIPEGTQPFTLLPARTLSGTAQRALPTLTCLESGARVTPDQPIKCRELSWQITLKPVPATGADASAQQNLYFPQGGWLVTEWGDFPRQQGAGPGLSAGWPVQPPARHEGAAADPALRPARDNPVAAGIPSANSS
ncbi:hypothetical protein [Aeromonas bestiarum]|uniref:hypothetical protein n=1 Tax=Aeromonas bestiarum TaxID=105751 RepID=UPI0032B2666B